MVIYLVMMKVGQNLIIWLSLRFEQFILLFLLVDIPNQVFCQQRDWIWFESTLTFEASKWADSYI